VHEQGCKYKNDTIFSRAMLRHALATFTIMLERYFEIVRYRRIASCLKNFVSIVSVSPSPFPDQVAAYSRLRR
jgi:hypothetical protein